MLLTAVDEPLVILQMLARMKQDMGSTPKVSEAPQEKALLQQQAPELPGKPGHARKPSLGADVTPRSGSSQRRKSMVSISILFMKTRARLADDWKGV